MKNILFICNVSMIDFIKNHSNGSGGWIVGVIKELSKNSEYKLSLTYPSFNNICSIDEKDGISYYSFYQERILPNNNKPKDESRYSKKLRSSLKKILNIVKPDLLFVFGTEFLHSQILVEEFNNPSKTIIHIQGLVTFYKDHCLFNLPFKVKYGIYPSTCLRGFGIKIRRDYAKKSLIEQKTMQFSNHLLGRTEWDRYGASVINPNAKYYFSGEILRDSIYDNRKLWSYEKCNKYTIYFSQGSATYKGLYHLLNELKNIVQKYPDTHLFIGGRNPIGDDSFKSKLVRSSYGYYLHSIIKKNKLSSYITFLGNQTEEQVVKNILSANVFIAPSNIENSSNAIGEAVMLGIPVIASDVGGVKDIVFHNENGFIYPLDESYMINYYISMIFDNKFEVKYSTMLDIFDKENNKEQLNRIIHKVLK